MMEKVHISVNIAENSSYVSIISRCIAHMDVAQIHNVHVHYVIFADENFANRKSSKYTLRECIAVRIAFFSHFYVTVFISFICYFVISFILCGYFCTL
jgi:hypothetical protein